MSFSLAEKYGVGMLIWQFLHREDYKAKSNRDRVQFAKFTYNATSFNRYIQPRSKDGLDRADQMLTKYLLKHVAEMQVDHLSMIDMVWSTRSWWIVPGTHS